MYIVFNVFYFYSGVGQKDSGVGRAHLAPPFATPMSLMSLAIQLNAPIFCQSCLSFLRSLLLIVESVKLLN
jgi:hypothetical protein